MNTEIYTSLSSQVHRNIRFALGALALMLLVPFSLQASHIVGGEMSYECLGNNQYKIKLKVFRDCFFGDPNAYFDDPAYVGIWNRTTMTMDTIHMPFMMIDDTLSNNIMDPCITPLESVCVHTTFYEKIVTLPLNTDGYNIIYQRCCRNVTLSNIMSPDSTGATFSIFLKPDIMADCNDLVSPEFNSTPDFGGLAPIYICANKELEYDHSAMDADGDSLVYKLCNPLTGGSYQVPQPKVPSPPPFDSVAWIDPPYNVDNMLGGGIPLEIDPQTGLLTAFPAFQGQFVVGVCVEEYRNGVLLSTTRRDFQYNVVPCSEIISSFFAPDVQCENLTVEFDNQSEFASQYRWFFDWPNPTPGSLQFEPTYTFPDTGTYTVALIAQPGAVCADTFFHEIFLQYNSLDADFTLEEFPCLDSSVLILQDLSTDNVSPVNQWLWEVFIGNDTLTSTEQNPVFTVPSPGSGQVRLTARSVNGCENTKTLSFTTTGAPPDSLFITTDTICVGETVFLNPNFQQITSYGWSWQPANLVSDPTAPNPSTSPPTTTTFTVSVYSIDSICFYTKEITIVVNEVDADFEASLSACETDEVTVLFTDLTANNLNNTVSWDWTFSNGDVSDQQNPSIVLDASQNLTADLTVTTAQGCQSSTSQMVNVQLIDVQIADSVTICQGESVPLNPGANTSYLYSWEPANLFLNPNAPNPSVSPDSTTTYTATITQIGFDTCTITRTITVVVNQISADFAFELSSCETDQAIISFTDLSTNNLNSTVAWDWDFGPLGTSDQQNPTLVVANSQTVSATLQITSAEGCTAEKTESIPVVLIADPQLPDSIRICPGDSEALNPGFNPAYQYFWEPAGLFADPTEPNPTVSPDQTTIYTVTITQFGFDTCSIQRQIMAFVPPVIGLTASDDVTTCDAEATLSAGTVEPAVLAWEDQNGNPVAGDVPSITVDVSGAMVYSVIATDQYQCEEVETVLVAGGPVDILASDDLEVCSNEPINIGVTNLDPNDMLSFSWTPLSDIVSGANTANPVISNSPGIKDLTVVVTNQFNCADTAQVQVTVIDVNNQLDFSHIIQCDGLTVEFTNESLNAFDFVWDFGDPNTQNDTSTLINPSYMYPDTGTYTVTLTLAANVACVTPATSEVEIVFPILLADFDYTYENCAEDEILIAFTDQSLNFQNNTNSWNWDFGPLGTSNEQNPTISVTSDQTVNVTLTIGTEIGCVATTTQSFDVDLIDDVNLQDTLILCYGDTTQLNPSANFGYSYLWSPATGLSDPASPNPQAFPLETTTYTVAITNFGADTCEIFQTVTVVVSEDIQLNITQDLVNCNQPATLTVNSNVSPLNYVWTSDTDPGFMETGPTIVVDPNATSTYTVVATDNLNCTASDEVTVTVPPQIFVDVTDDLVNCNQPATLTAGSTVSPTTFEWFDDLGDPAGSGPVIVVDPNATTTYTVVGTDEFGCQDTQMVIVTVPVPIELVVTNDTISCNAPMQLTVSGNFTPLDFEWFDQNGSIDDTPTILVDPDTTTTYYVVATDQYGCQETDSVLVTVPTELMLDITPDTTACDLPVELLVISNVQPVDYEWTDPASNVISQDSTVVIMNPGQQTTYSVLVTDAFGCQETEEVTVTNGVINLLAEGTLIECPADEYAITVTNADPNDILNYVWTAGQGGVILSGETSNMPTVTTTQDSAYFYVDVSNQFGCELTDSVLIVVAEFEPVFQDTVEICPGVGTFINPGANPNYSYQWFPADGLSSDTVGNPIATLDTSMAYTVIITNFGSLDTCSATLEVFVQVNPPIDLIASAADTILCDLGATTTLSAFSAESVEFFWYDDPALTDPFDQGSPVTVTPVGAQTYYVIAVDGLECQDTVALTVNSFPIDIATVSPVDLCYGDTISLTLINNAFDQELVSIQWTPNETIIGGTDTTANPLVNVLESTTYTVMVENQYGCTGTDEVFVNLVDVITSLFASADPDTLIFNSGQTSQLLTVDNPDYSYIWTPGETLDDPFVFDPIASPDETTLYFIEVEGEAGCRGVDSVLVVVINPPCDTPYIFVPTGFTPNNDGNNDVLYVYGDNADVDEIYFAIYNRWGQKVFETRDITVGWDGTFKGELLTPDVYGWYLETKCYNGESFFDKGNVTLIR